MKLRHLMPLLLLAACQPVVTAPQPTSPGTSNQVITLPQIQTFSAELSGASEIPAVTSDARGYGVFQLNNARDTLTVRVFVSGLSGVPTGAHLHQGATGANGEVVKDLVVAGNVLTASWKKSDATQPLTDALLERLSKGELYANVHTAANPNGEIRGQLASSRASLFPIYLSGAEEVPAVTTTATGVAWASLNADGSALTLTGSVHGLSGPITGSHIHRGAKGSNGNVLKDVVVNGSRLSLTWTRTDSSNALTPGVLDLLAKGELYLNVHTAAHANGEIRGQIQ